jgi:hypothetical protein
MSRGETEKLRDRIAELEEQLRIVTAERDEALRTAACAELIEPIVPGVNVCGVCEGEGVFWVHDFRMDCKRCGGTGQASPQ